MKSSDPARMSAKDILAEVAELLAVGFQRSRAQESKAAGVQQISRDHLDVVGDVEAQCGETVEANG